MEKLLLFIGEGFVLGIIFVEFTYRLAGRGHLLLYLLSLPVKLLLFAFALFLCYSYGYTASFFYCLLGFLPGFLITVFLRGFLRNGRPESA